MVSMGHRSFRMVVAVTTTAVIDNQLNPGPAWPLLRRLLACNAHSSVQEALVEVVLLSGDGTRERRAWDIARATGLRMRRVGSGIRGRSWRDARALDVSLFADGDLVDVVGVSKGKGFAGTIKRHSFARGPETHGADHHREPGSIGAGTTPGRVYRGTRMAGHMGVERVTVLKMKIVRSDGERNLLLIKGSVPGAKNALVAVSKAEQI